MGGWYGQYRQGVVLLKFWADKSLEEEIYLYMTVEVLEGEKPDDRRDER